MLDFLKKALPWIGAAATGNVPALITMAAKTVGDIIGQDVAPEADAIASAVAGASPEQIAQMRQADNDFKLKMQALGFQHVEEMAKLGFQETQAFIGDTQDARNKHAQNKLVFWLGVTILVTFAAIMGFSMVIPPDSRR